jgi:disease resistance protein RPM1
MVDGGYKLYFPWNKMGSRILITATRDDRIVQSQWARVVTRFYYMSGLTGDYARLLFYRRALGSEDRCPPELAQVADQVLSQCHGSPLAITVMAGLLAKKPRTRPVWEDILSYIGRSNNSSNRTEEICLMGYYLLRASELPEDLLGVPL